VSVPLHFADNQRWKSPFITSGLAIDAICRPACCTSLYRKQAFAHPSGWLPSCLPRPVGRLAFTRPLYRVDFQYLLPPSLPAPAYASAAPQHLRLGRSVLPSTPFYRLHSQKRSSLLRLSPPRPHHALAALEQLTSSEYGCQLSPVTAPLPAT